MPYKLVLAPSFKKAYAKLGKKEQAQVENKIRQLAKFEEGHLILLLDVGHHDALLRRRTRR